MTDFSVIARDLTRRFGQFVAVDHVSFEIRRGETLIGRSFEAANQAVTRLQEAGVVRKIVVGRRNRAFEVPELIEAFIGLERRLASPDGDTRFSAPSRPVPALPAAR